MTAQKPFFVTKKEVCEFFYEKYVERILNGWLATTCLRKVINEIKEKIPCAIAKEMVLMAVLTCYSQVRPPVFSVLERITKEIKNTFLKSIAYFTIFRTCYEEGLLEEGEKYIEKIQIPEIRDEALSRMAFFLINEVYDFKKALVFINKIKDPLQRYGATVPLS